MPPVRVRAKIDNLTVADRTLARGEEADCPSDRAKYLKERGLVDVLEGDETPQEKRKGQPERATSPARAAAENASRKG
jgi:hypothetical protein